MNKWQNSLLIIALLGWISALYWHVRLLLGDKAEATDYTNKRNISLLVSSIVMNSLVGSLVYTFINRSIRSNNSPPLDE